MINKVTKNEKKQYACDDNEIKAYCDYDQKQKKRRDSKSKIENSFKAVEDMSMVDPVVLNTEAYKII